MWKVPLLIGLFSATSVVASQPGEPVRLLRGYPVISAMINGQGPFQMVFDTGSSACSMSLKAAQKAGIQPQYRLDLRTLNGQEILPAGKAASVRVGNFTESEVEFALYTSPALRELSGALDGVLGQSFLNGTVWMLDFRKGRLYLGADARARAETLPDPISFERVTGRIALSARIYGENRARQLVLDSGAPSMILRCSTECPMLLSPNTVVLSTGLGPSSAQIGMVPSVEVAGNRFLRADTVLVPHQPDRVDDPGVLPARWFAALFVDNEQNLIRMRAR